MATDVLQAFLSKRLFDVGGDDGRVKALRNAADDMVAIIKAAPQRTQTFTMIAIDSAIEPDEPVVSEVMKVLEKRWNSYAGAFTDSSLPSVARAILLHALSAACSFDSIAAAVSLTARNMLPYLGDRGDRALWIEIIGEADRKLTRRSEREWALPSSSAASEVELFGANEVQLEPPIVDQDWLKSRLMAAAGPQNAQGEALKGANSLQTRIHFSRSECLDDTQAPPSRRIRRGEKPLCRSAAWAAESRTRRAPHGRGTANSWPL